jgi:hypothetical protein
VNHRDFYIAGGGKENSLEILGGDWFSFVLVFFGIYIVQHQNVEINILIQKKQKHFMIM